MFKKRYLFYLSLLFLCVGFIFFMIQRKWIIIQLPFGQTSLQNSDEQTAEKIVAKIYFYQDSKWRNEEVVLIGANKDKATKVKQLVKNWLSILKEEHIVPLYVNLESVALSSTGADVYLSFDRNIFHPNVVIIKKWMIIEGLLKTLVDASLSLQTIQFFVHHKPMEDEHIDFMQPLPVQQFLAR